MCANKFPYTVQPLDSKLDEKVKSLFLAGREGSVQIGPKKYVLSFKYGQVAESLYNFEVRSDDVWIVTVPRSGTTLTQEMVWLILNDDYDTAVKVNINKRFPFLESSILTPDHVIEEVTKEMVDDDTSLSLFPQIGENQWEILENTSGRRFIKTHIPLSLLPPTLLTSGAKVIYVARNPKNVSISRYHQECSLKIYNFAGNFEAYWDLFENDLVHYTPYWAHLEEGWQQRGGQNFLFLFYEDIVKDYKEAIVQVSKFLGKDINDGQVSKLAEFLNKDTYRAKMQLPISILKRLGAKGIYQHIGSGNTDNWGEYFTEELEAKANKWIEENYKGTTLRFPIKLY